jgi:hypothetical protein
VSTTACRRVLIEHPLCVCLIPVEIHAHLVQHCFEVLDHLRRGLQPVDQLLNEVRRALIHILFLHVLEFPSVFLLLPADREYVVDRIDDLPDFLLVFILPIYFVLEILLEGGVFLRNPL